ncbi:MAG: acyltransferase [Burkholderia gladioli]
MSQFPNNNFNSLRLIAAFLVLFSHQFALLGKPEPNIGFHSLGGLGVLIFFSISGYLVAKSWQSDPSIPRFLAKRVLRIWPGLIVVTLISVFVLGPIMTTLPIAEYFSSPVTWKFLGTLKLTIRFDLPGVFAANPVQRAVNGSLWTLPLEFRWYLILLALGIVTLLRRHALLLIGTIAFAGYVFVLHDPLIAPNRQFSLEFGAFFLYGVCLYYFHESWQRRTSLFLTAVLILAAALYADHRPYLALLAALPPCIIVIGSASTPVLRDLGRLGDLSYGVYIYAFPVQQTIVSLTDSRIPLNTALGLSLACTLLLAFASWHLVEAPALKLRSRIRRHDALALHGERVT